MNKNINITHQSKVAISTGKDNQSVEIGNSAIDNGLLKQFPDSSLAIFLYLITHLEKGQYVLTNPAIISGYLPYDINTIKKGLNYLTQRDIIKVSQEREGNYTFRIYVNLDKITLSQDKQENEIIYERDLRKQIVRKNIVSREELSQALVSFIPRNKAALIRDEINHWLDDFDHKILQELIRRVDKWLDNNNYDSAEKAFYYLQGIINDWYQKEIFTYDRLKYFDQLYRETKDLAYTYGIKGWQNINPIQMETFKRWLTDDFALSSSVAKYAIKEAIQRKKDGQPSLKYIEDNFIIPWKKAGIKNIEEAKSLLNKQSSHPKANNKQKGETKKYKWEDFYWDFNKYKET